MTDNDFDFDFDVNRAGSSSGTHSPADSEPAASPRKRNGARESDPFEDLLDDAPDAEGEGNGRGARQRERDAVRRNGGNGSRDDASRSNGRREQKRSPGNGSAGAAASDEGADRDWLSLADDGLADDGLDSIAEGEDGPAGPRTLGEGRSLARNARRRATGRANGAAEVGEFEALLERQPQKSAVAKRGSAAVYGLRGLLDDGRERLRGGRSRLSALKERLPSVPAARPGSGDDGAKQPPSLPKRMGSRRPRKPKPGRVKKLRIAIILVGLGALAMVSTVFGMMMAVAGDLPALEDKQQYAAAKNSEVFDSQGRKVGTLLSNNRRILVDSADINPYIKQAVVAIEDQRFYEHRGVDFRGISRAVVADVIPGGSTQGASTITQQFVKNALEAQNSRTVFQKLRESALAYHLERQWDKDKILTQYLNTIYFGEGAYGIEAAARTYFGHNHPECLAAGADSCSSELAPEEAAMLAGIISSPSAFSPRANPQDALARRNLVLAKMTDQELLSQEEYDTATRTALPAPSDIEKPEEDSLAPYFTSWMRQQVVDLYGAGKAFGGGLDVHTTIDLDMQEAAESAAYNTLAGIAPTASVAVIDNKTGAVRALVGGNDYAEKPFNLATNGHRQPGSAFKPFTLVTALENGLSLGSPFYSEIKTFPVPNSGGKEFFEVHNYDDTYYGPTTLGAATVHSDNSVFAQVGDRLGTKKIAQTAQVMGIETPVSTNQSMVLGAIDPGVTPLEMAYAFSTLARGGLRVGGNLDTSAGANDSPDDLAPLAVSKIKGPEGDVIAENKSKEIRVVPENVADTVVGALEENVQSGTGVNAQTGDFAWGKTGTTENNGDAWFVGGTENFTIAVWVGHAQTNTPMETEYAGNPVDGGTFPALIWSQIAQAIESIRAAEEADRADGEADGTSDESTSSGSSSAPSSSAPAPSGGGSGRSTPRPAPSGGGGGGGGSGTGGTGGTGL